MNTIPLVLASDRHMCHQTLSSLALIVQRNLHLHFLSPLEPGLPAIFSGFKKVMTVEINYSDKADAPLITPENRRYAQLAMVLRAQTLVDIDCWSEVLGQPLKPGVVERVILEKLDSRKEQS